MTVRIFDKQALRLLGLRKLLEKTADSVIANKFSGTADIIVVDYQNSVGKIGEILKKQEPVIVMFDEIPTETNADFPDIGRCNVGSWCDDVSVLIKKIRQIKTEQKVS